MKHFYEVKNTGDLISPCLIYYLDIIKSNTEKAIALAGSAKRLWPHVKSHKSRRMVELQMAYGIKKFKAATVAEAEMTAAAGAEAVILAYPLTGPNIGRFIRLAKAYPDTVFYAVGDNETSLQQLGEACREQHFIMNVLIDVNMGMNRTGILPAEVETLWGCTAVLPGLHLRGLHCYDGNHNQPDFAERNRAVTECDDKIAAIAGQLRAKGVGCDIIVAGGTPSFPCHAQHTDWYLSPGTAFLSDAGYYKSLPDLDFIPGAAVLTRVVSHPAPGLFTVDLGYKGIAADPVGQRGFIIGMEAAEAVLHSEEHWVFQQKGEIPVPAVGTCLYVIPTHICPTSALYPEVLVASDGIITDTWEITSRNRKIIY